MKIVLLNTLKNGGGAAIACTRLFNAFKKNKKNDSVYLLNLRAKNNILENEYGLENSKIQAFKNLFLKTFEKAIFFFYEKSKAQRWSFSLANTGHNISKLPIIEDADVLHLHWINQGFLSLKNIEQLLNTNKKIVFTLHDMWLFTGGCHHSRNCNYYETKCNHCFYLKKPSENDLSTKIFLQKVKIFENRKNVHIVTCSNWLKNKAQQSAILKNIPISAIPNAFNLEIFKPKIIDTNKINSAIHPNKIKILFGCANLNNVQKGILYLIEALVLLHQKNKYDIQILLVGQQNETLQNTIPFETIYLGNINVAEKMAEIYNIADMFVLPSLEENLPNMLIESLACGTPCVAFNIGGIPEIIQHQQNGYLAMYKSVDDLCNGIEWIIENKSEQLSTNCVNYAEKNYSEAVIAEKYRQVYK